MDKEYLKRWDRYRKLREKQRKIEDLQKKKRVFKRFWMKRALIHQALKIVYDKFDVVRTETINEIRMQWVVGRVEWKYRQRQKRFSDDINERFINTSR